MAFGPKGVDLAYYLEQSLLQYLLSVCGVPEVVEDDTEKGSGVEIDELVYRFSVVLLEPFDQGDVIYGLGLHDRISNGLYLSI